MIAMALVFQTFAGALMDPMGNLPFLFDAVPMQVSSYDRTGANNDGFDGSYSFLRRDKRGEYVLFEEEGPGYVGHLWFTAPHGAGNIRFYFDGEETPRVDMPIMELFSGNRYPFLNLLAGDDRISSGGFYVYLPMPYRKGLRITTTHIPRFYHITYLRLPSAQGIETFDPKLNPMEDHFLYSTIARWDRRGTLADFVSGPDVERHSTIVSVAAGEEQVLFETEGSGTIVAIELTPVHNDDWESHRALTLRAYWDGNPEPAVEVPLLQFFGAVSNPPITYRSLPLGITESNMYCTFPMPYADGARFTLHNAGTQFPENVLFNVYYRKSVFAPAPDMGRFHAWASEQIAREGRPIEILRRAGRGKFAGVVMGMVGHDFGYLEGDELFYIDGADYPNLYGTGTEDYFNGGWYFGRGLFSLPFHGHHVRRQDKECGVYRFHVLDPIPFQKQIQAYIEHGAGCERVGTRYRLTSYWYEDPSTRGGELSPEPPYPPHTNRTVLHGSTDGDRLQERLAGIEAFGAPFEMIMPELLDPMFRGAPIMLFSAREPGNSFRFPLEVSAPDRYALRIVYAKSPNSGRFRVEIDGKPVGKEIDTYAPEFSPNFIAHLGDINLPMGGVGFSIIVTGKHPDSEGHRILIQQMSTQSLSAFIEEWYVLGPFDIGEKRAFFHEVHPIEEGPVDLNATYIGKDGNEIRWQRVTADSGGRINLEEVFNRAEHAVAFAYASVTVQEPLQDTHLLVGSDDGIRVYIGDRRVHNNPVDRAFNPDQDLVLLSLPEGEHRILAKIYNGGAGWAFSLRFADPDGKLEFVLQE